MRKKIKNKVYLDGKRVQLIDIYYSGIGMLRELIPEEMEEAFQKHLAKQKKTAQPKATPYNKINYSV